MPHSVQTIVNKYKCLLNAGLMKLKFNSLAIQTVITFGVKTKKLAAFRTPSVSGRSIMLCVGAYLQEGLEHFINLMVS